jgi:hypothetical protein
VTSSSIEASHSALSFGGAVSSADPTPRLTLSAVRDGGRIGLSSLRGVLRNDPLPIVGASGTTLIHNRRDDQPAPARNQ